MKETPDQKPVLEGFSPFDAADYLNSEEDIEAFIEAAEEDYDPAFMVLVDETVARARERLANPLQGIKVTLDDL